MPVEQVVTEDETDWLTGDELLPDEQRLRDALRLGLGRIADADTPLRAIPEKPRKQWAVLGRRDQQDVP